MNKKTYVKWGGAAVVVGLIIMVIIAFVGTMNSYSRIEVKAAALQTDNKNVLDNTRKAIREAASVSDKEVEALTNIITGYADSRGPNPDGGDNNIISMGMVTEAVPSITDIKTLGRLQNIVVAGRKDWQAAQTHLIEVKRRGDEMMAVFPSSLILSMVGKQPIDITVITSQETEGNFATGKDDGSWLESKPKK